MSTQGTYCEIQKTGGYLVRLSLEEYKGNHRADLRQYYSTDEGHKPTRQGVSIPIQEIPDLVAGLSKLHSAAQAAGIVGGDSHE